MTLKQTLLAAAVAGTLTGTAQASLLISEYVEGSSFTALPDMTCGAEATRISAIQGNTAASPLNGSDVVIEAVVTGVFNGANRLGGFFVEEESADRDGDPASSEGLFIYGNQSVTPGDTVRVAGTSFPPTLQRPPSARATPVTRSRRLPIAATWWLLPSTC